MSNLPKIYATCKAGCLWETVHRSEFLNSASIVKMALTNGAAAVPALQKYKIKTAHKSEAVVIAKAMPTTTEAAVASVGKKVYIFGGMSGSATLDTIQVFDTETFELITLETKLLKPTSSMSAVAFGTDIYLFGGVDANTAFPVYVFDTLTNTLRFTEVAGGVASYQPRYSMAAAKVGSRIYFFGGMRTQFEETPEMTTDICSYNILTDESFILSNVTLPIALTNMSAAAVGDKIYLFGGYASSGYVNTIYAFDTKNLTISKLSTVLPVATRSMGAVAIGSKIYLFGGYTASGAVNSVYVYDTYANTISKLSATLPTASYNVGAVAINSVIYLTSIAGNKIGLLSGDYTCELTLNCGSKALDLLTAKAYDKYRNTLTAEIVAIVENESHTELTVVYELNGKRYIETVSGTGLYADNCSLQVSGVEELYHYNSDAEIVAYITSEDLPEAEEASF